MAYQAFLISMKLLVLFLLISPYLSSAQLLEWNEYYRLTWDDFQGKPTPVSKGDAGTFVQIKAKPYLVGGEAFYDVHAYFDREQSWATEKSRSLLAHEQLHFDIAELYARKIRKRIHQLKSEGVKDVSKINAAVRHLLEESNEADIRYDAETLHGSLRSKQAQWEEKVSNEMASLERFKKPKKIIRVNR